MNARERLIAVLNHQEPDQLPIDLGGTAATTITINAYRNLRKFLKLPELQPEMISVVGQTVKPHTDLLNLFHIDTRGVYPRSSGDWELNILEEEDYQVFYDEWGIGYRRPKEEGLYFDIFYHPLAGDKQIKDIENYPFPKGGDKNRIKGLREQCLAYREQGYPVIVGNTIGSGFLQTSANLMGFEDYLTKIILEPEVIEALSEIILQIKCDFWDLVLNEVGELVDVVYEADDLGTQRGPLISPQMYRRFIKPYQRKLIDYIKSKAPHVKLFFHSCGSVVQFILDFIEIGVDGLNPVQISAEGMAPERLKREFGKHIIFWGGGVDTQHILSAGTPDQVRADVRKNVSIFAKDGGFVFATVHNIQADVPPENILAMYETVAEFL